MVQMNSGSPSCGCFKDEYLASGGKEALMVAS